MPDHPHYDALAEVYDFLVPEALLDPAGSLATFAEWLGDLPPGAEVLDCACGPGHLAVGLAQQGCAVTATDASPAMVARAVALAAAHGVELDAERLTWDALGDRPWTARFAAVLCVGNSLVHAAGAAARLRALRNMSRVVRPGGRVVVTSRNWEAVRAAGSHVSVGDEVVTRDGRRALVVHHWAIADDWPERHRLFVGVALLEPGDRVRTVAEELDFWPFRHEELLDDLAAAGLRVRATTYADGADRYVVVAERAG